MKALLFVHLLLLLSCRDRRAEITYRQLDIKHRLETIQDELNDPKAHSLPPDIFKKRFDSLTSIQQYLFKQNDSLEAELKKIN